MAGISDKALKSQYAQNKYRFNGGNELQNKEFSDGSGLELYDAVHRMYDAQLGRFWQIDPLALFTNDVSCYAFALNNPMLRNDPTGLKDSVKTLTPVVVTAKKRTLQGGEYNGQSFNDIKEFRQLYASLSKRKIADPLEAGRYLKEQAENADKTAEQLKRIGELGGGAAPGSVKEIIELIKGIKSGSLKFSPIVLVAAQIEVEGVKMGMLAKDLQKIAATYIEIHSSSSTADPSPAKGIYEITTVISVQNTQFGLSNVITTTTYYDISTNKYLGEATSR
jgi:RHS repeat-associated protein